MFLSATQLILVSTLLLSVAGRLGHLSKYAELASHFKVQYLIGSAACLVACLFYREPVWAIAAAMGVAINLAAVAPWYAGRRKTKGISDLNITPWSPYYRGFVERTKLVNVRKGFGPLPSWPTFLFFKWLMLPLDHCLVSDDIHVAAVKTGEPMGSDHLPLIVELEL